MLNGIWVAMIFAAVVFGGLNDKLDAVAKASTDSAGAAVTLAIGMVGVMTFWLGLMHALRAAGILNLAARGLAPVLRWLFPEVPPEHPAMSFMIMNFTANMLGLGNAATPAGLKAMTELERLNPRKGTATNAMILFLAINTSGLALLPTGVINLRASLGSRAPGGVFMTTLGVTLICLVVSVLVTKLLVAFSPKEPVAVQEEAATAELSAELREARDAIALVPEAPPLWRRIVALLLLGASLLALGVSLYHRALAYEGGAVVGLRGALKTLVSDWMLVVLIVIFVLFAFVRGVRVYDAVVEGGKEGFTLALRIIPYLAALLVAIGMLRASGAIEVLAAALAPLTDLIGMPSEVLPMALMRPLSGTGAYGVAAELMKTYGPDSLIGNIACTMNGNETTFYVLALYYGSVQVRNMRFSLVPCLVSDALSVVAAVWLCRWFT